MNKKTVVVETMTLEEAKALWCKTFPEIEATYNDEEQTKQSRVEALRHLLGFIAALQTIRVIKRSEASQ